MWLPLYLWKGNEKKVNLLVLSLMTSWSADCHQDFLNWHEDVLNLNDKQQRTQWFFSSTSRMRMSRRQRRLCSERLFFLYICTFNFQLHVQCVDVSHLVIIKKSLYLKNAYNEGATERKHTHTHLSHYQNVL